MNSLNYQEYNRSYQSSPKLKNGFIMHTSNCIINLPHLHVRRLEVLLRGKLKLLTIWMKIRDIYL